MSAAWISSVIIRWYDGRIVAGSERSGANSVTAGWPVCDGLTDWGHNIVCILLLWVFYVPDQGLEWDKTTLQTFSLILLNPEYCSCICDNCCSCKYTYFSSSLGDLPVSFLHWWNTLKDEVSSNGQCLYSRSLIAQLSENKFLKYKAWQRRLVCFKRLWFGPDSDSYFPWFLRPVKCTAKSECWGWFWCMHVLCSQDQL